MLDTLVYLRHETDVWFEITTLLIPGLNDSDDELDADAAWIADQLGTDVPLHFTAFHPDFKMLDVAADAAGHADAGPATSRIGNGLRYVYTGNVHDRDGRHHVRARRAATAVIERDWYVIGGYRLDDDGRCRIVRHAGPRRLRRPARRVGSPAACRSGSAGAKVRP